MAFVGHSYKKELFLLFITLLLLAAGLAFQQHVSKMLEADMEEKLLEISTQVSQSMDSHLQSNYSTLHATANFFELNNSANQESIHRFVEQERTYNGFLRIGVVSLSGGGIYGPSLNRESLSLLRDVFRGNNMMAYLEESPFGEANCILLAVPYFREEAIIGAVYAIYDVVSLPGLSHTDVFGGEGRALLLGNQFQTAIPPLSHLENVPSLGQEATYANKKSSERMKMKLYWQRRAVEKYYLKNESVYIGVIPLKSLPGWYVCCAISSNVLMSKVQSIVLFASLIVIGLCFLLVTMTWLLEALQQKSNRRIYELAYLNKLTHIPNWEKLRQDSIPLLSVPGENYCLSVLDIDGFHTMNSMLGKPACDRLLCGMSTLFTNCLGKGELAGHVAEDRFSLLLLSDKPQEIRQRLLRVMNAVSGLLPNFHITISAGACYLEGGTNASVDSALENCMFAQKTAKAERCNSMAFYDQNLEALQRMYRTLENDFSRAIEERDFILYLHPFVNLGTEEIVGAEVLVRWRHPKFGMLKPDKFFPLLEANGLIHTLDRYTLREACTLMQNWRAQGKNPPPIFISLSHGRLVSRDVSTELTETVRRYGLPLSLVGFALTDAYYKEDARVSETISSLQREGFQICVRDFSAAHLALENFSSISRNYVKLNKSLFENWGSDQVCAQRLVLDIVTMFHHLGALVIFEGVISQEQASILRNAGCDCAQGEYFLNPVPHNAYEQLLKPLPERPLEKGAPPQNE